MPNNHNIVNTFRKKSLRTCCHRSLLNILCRYKNGAVYTKTTVRSRKENITDVVSIY